MALLAGAPAAQAYLYVTIDSTSDLDAIRVGESFTLEITIEETLGEGAYALGFRAANYDPEVIAFESAVVPTSIFNFSPTVPIGGLLNLASGEEEAPLAGVRPGWSVNLFQGLTTSYASGGGPDAFSVTFMGVAAGETRVDAGAFEDYSDGYFHITYDGEHYFDGVSITVIPEPGTALLTGLGLFGLALGRRRRGAACARSRSV